MAVLVGGGLVDFLGTAITVNALTFVLFELVGGADARRWYFSFSGQVVVTAMGCICSFFGALTAAFVARRRPVIHALLSLLAAHLVAIPLWYARGSWLDSPIQVAGLGSCILAAVAAGKLVAKLSPNEPMGEREVA